MLPNRTRVTVSSPVYIKNVNGLRKKPGTGIRVVQNAASCDELRINYGLETVMIIHFFFYYYYYYYYIKRLMSWKVISGFSVVFPLV